MGPEAQHTKRTFEDPKGSLCVWREDRAEGGVRWGWGLGAGFRITRGFRIRALS